MGKTRYFTGLAGPSSSFRSHAQQTSKIPALHPVQYSPMQGLHLTADLTDCQCDSAWLTNAARLGAACVQAVQMAGLQSVAQLCHTFPSTAQGPGGVTATVLLAESHLCVHTWPEQRGVTLDVYVCNFGGNHNAKAHALMDALLALFAPTQVSRHQIERGLTRSCTPLNGG
jgi:S-adenosylmethionine decarboxylase